MRIAKLTTLTATAVLSLLVASPAAADSTAPDANAEASPTASVALLPIDPIGTVCGLLPDELPLCPVNSDPWK
ncbi:hypothetical protein [Nocardiopsis halotolerans]|uniref:hypothetical protein n=1 Tax=Nocardiopsis halotolerans TaxID=124252 RepID=UPI00034B2F71|nr:hypothetical protein [Nocardiopsis halotolerans]